MNMSHHLYLFNHIISYGQQLEGKFHFEELSAWHDIDGYTCYIGYKDLTMSLYFHSRFDYDYQEKATFKEFFALVETIYIELKGS
jgi:hypothetical protein